MHVWLCQWLLHTQLVAMQPGKREEEEDSEQGEEREEEVSNEEASEEDSEEEEEGGEDSSEEEVPHPLQMRSLQLHAQARTNPLS